MTIEERLSALEEKVATLLPQQPVSAVTPDAAGELGLQVMLSIYPDARHDDEGYTRNEWYRLTPAERIAALNGVVPFIAALLSGGRKYPPAVWCYLRDKRWTLVAPLAAASLSAKPLPMFPFTGEAGFAYMLSLLKPGTVLKDHDRAILTNRWQRMPAAEQIKAVNMAALEAGEEGIDCPVILFLATRSGRHQAEAEDF